MSLPTHRSFITALLVLVALMGTACTASPASTPSADAAQATDAPEETAATGLRVVSTVSPVVNIFNRIILLSTAIGALTGFVGMYLSYYVDIASGATIVLSQATLFVVVLTITSLQKRAQQRLVHTHV